jgi:hypothetical protein
MNKLNWTSPKLTKYERENVEILSSKGNLGAELGATTSPS